MGLYRTQTRRDAQGKRGKRRGEWLCVAVTRDRALSVDIHRKTEGNCHTVIGA